MAYRSARACCVEHLAVEAHLADHGLVPVAHAVREVHHRNRRLALDDVAVHVAGDQHVGRRGDQFLDVDRAVGRARPRQRRDSRIHLRDEPGRAQCVGHRAEPILRAEDVRNLAAGTAEQRDAHRLLRDLDPVASQVGDRSCLDRGDAAGRGGRRVSPASAGEQGEQRADRDGRRRHARASFHPTGHVTSKVAHQNRKRMVAMTMRPASG